MTMKTIFDELEADGVAAIDEMQTVVKKAAQRIRQHGDRRMVQIAKLNALGNIIFQELLEEINTLVGNKTK